MLGGLYMRELCSHVPHFWEHLMFDVKRNWILCGHDGGSAGFILQQIQAVFSFAIPCICNLNMFRRHPSMGWFPSSSSNLVESLG